MTGSVSETELYVEAGDGDTLLVCAVFRVDIDACFFVIGRKRRRNEKLGLQCDDGSIAK